MHRMRGGLVVLLVAVLVVIGLVAAGMIHYQQSGDQVDVTIETGELKQATEKAVEEGKEALKNTAEAFEQVGEKVQQGLKSDEP